MKSGLDSSHFRFRQCLLGVAFFVLAAPSLWAGEIFVSPSGSDASGDGSQLQPYATISRAITSASDGDTILLRAGTFPESIQLASWHGVENVTFVAYEDEPVTVAATENDVVGLFGVRGITFRNLRFTDGVVAVQSGSSDILFEGCSFEGVDALSKGQNSFLFVSGTDGLAITACFFLGNRSTDLIFLGGSNDNVSITDSVFRDNFASSGVQQSTIALVQQSPSSSIRIDGNLFEFTGPKENRPTLPQGVDAYGVFLYQCNGGDFASPKIAITNNTIRNYRYRGTQDDTWYDPTYLKTPEEGGERAQGLALVECDAVLIEGNRFESISGHGLNGFMVRYLTISGNEFVGLGKNGIFLVGDQATKSGASPNWIIDNRMKDGGWLVGGTSGISTIFTGPGNVIARNFISGQVNGIASTEGGDWYGDGNGILADLDSSGTAIIGNLVVGNQGAGISLNRSSDSLIAFNTVVGNGHCPHRADNYGVFIAGNHGPADRNRVINNLLYNNRLGQFWVFGTALDHTVHHNLYAAGPLTIPGRINLPIDWNGAFYSVPQWCASPPVPGNGVGALGERPVFLGDLADLDGESDRFTYLPVNDSPGTGDAFGWGGLPVFGGGLGLSGYEVYGSAMTETPGSYFARPMIGANFGALEPPTDPIPLDNGDSLTLLQPGGNASWVQSIYLQTVLQWNGIGPTTAELGTLSYAGLAPGWVVTGLFGYVWFGSSEGGSSGWLFGERFGWMKFEASGGKKYLWVPLLETWMEVRPDGSFYSFDFRELVPKGLKTYESPILGKITVGDFNGWVASDRFGWVWAARGTNGVWFWSEDRQEWLGVLPDGSIWSTRDGRFL